MDFYAGGSASPGRRATSSITAPRAWKEAFQESRRLQEQIDAAGPPRCYNSLDPESPERLEGRESDSDPNTPSEERSNLPQIRHRPTRQRKAHPKLPMACKPPSFHV